ncbi:hypothetical protein [Halorubrum vacuolatum]|nr:hypothetical protein [Halorubrum vacuolatum]
MTTSDALSATADLLSLFEDNGSDIGAVSMAETDDIVGTVEVNVPVFDASRVPNDAVFDVVAAGIEGGTVELSLEFTLGSNGRCDAGVTGTDGSDRAHTTTDPNSTPIGSRPSYKNPRELKKVYEEFDTFPEMTEALGVEVTPETVRRYMVKYDIHDPTTAGRMNGQMRSESRSSTEAAAGAPDVEAVEQASVADAGETETDVSDGAEGDESSLETPDTSSLEERPVVELLEQGAADGASSIVTDGSGIPGSLTVGELADVLESSRTISEVQRSLGLEYQQTRHMLRTLGLVEFVTGRLTAPDSTVPPKLVAERLSEFFAGK